MTTHASLHVPGKPNAVPAGNSDAQTLDKPTDVIALLRQVRNVTKALPTRVKLRMPQLDADIARFGEARLNAMLHGCGCHAANVCGCLGLVGYVAWLTLVVGSPATWTWSHLGYGLVACLSASIAGRGLHHLRTRHKLARELRQLLAHARSDD